MSTHVDGAAPSLAPDPEGGEPHDDAAASDPGSDSELGSEWVRAEMLRRMAENRSTRGRHARSGEAAAERTGPVATDGPRQRARSRADLPPATPAPPSSAALQSSPGLQPSAGLRSSPGLQPSPGLRSSPGSHSSTGTQPASGPQSASGTQTVPSRVAGSASAADLPENYVPRHSVQTPGPAADPAAPISGPIPIVRPAPGPLVNGEPIANVAAPEPRIAGPLGGPAFSAAGLPIRRRRGNGPGLPLQADGTATVGPWTRPGPLVPTEPTRRRLGAPPEMLGAPEPIPSWGLPLASPPHGFPRSGRPSGGGPAPADAAPTETAPAGTAPTDDVARPDDAALIDDAAPIDDAARTDDHTRADDLRPADNAPTDSAPTDSAPTDGTARVESDVESDVEVTDPTGTTADPVVARAPAVEAGAAPNGVARAQATAPSPDAAGTTVDGPANGAGPARTAAMAPPPASGAAAVVADPAEAGPADAASGATARPDAARPDAARPDAPLPDASTGSASRVAEGRVAASEASGGGPSGTELADMATAPHPVVLASRTQSGRPVAVPGQRSAERTVTPRPLTPRQIPVVGTAPPEPGSTRVRVVLSERKGVARAVRTIKEVQEGTAVGELLRTNLIRSQLRVTLRFALLTALVLGALPAVFAMMPEVSRFSVLGMRLPWVLLGVLMYPFLVGVAWRYTRVADRVEQNFADHVQD